MDETNETVLVTGATGQVGRHVVAGLVEAGVPVRALTRNPETADLPDDAEVVAGSQLDPAGLARHLDGVSAVLFMLPDFDLDALTESVRVVGDHVRHVVLLSSGAVRDDVPTGEQPGPIAHAHAVLEEAIRATGVSWTFLRPYGFAANTLEWAQAIRSRQPVALVQPEMPTAPVDERDIAAVAVRALTEDGHDGARYELTGPELVTPARQLEIIGEVTGRHIAWKEQPAEEWARSLLGPDTPDEVIAGMVDDFTDRDPAHTDTVARVTGRPAHTYRDWVEAHTRDLAGLLPPVSRADAGYVLVSTWRVADTGSQRAAGAAAVDDWRDRPWPAGLLAHSVLLGTDGHTLVHYSQWTDEESLEQFRRAGRTARNDTIDADVPGIERLDAAGYRLYREAVPEQPFEPGVVVLVSFRTDTAATGERFVDELIGRHPVTNGEPAPEGMAGNHFHIAVDGSRMLNWAEFATVEAHERVVAERLQADDDVPQLVERTPGLDAVGFQRFVPYRTVYGPPVR
ncbi:MULTISPECIES: NAD(P)H-binding protein [Prauserella salsuginis group]|uniref:NAD(P)H-binding protein n=1 Tax=Prauserella salsuginis TaxID=387889 RepID=A0ABW6G3E6_9PSEU|nr:MULTISPECIES: NAD(P)H-binding protein [Prauserella salsuginis group]MCR3718562.1 Uncharacterized conserved protein YbjT, contains NAD(P)-binding and DUF2867 domains [Prauserella flava]MCR3733132.1 Uncharacterized conserved protein YbjT, contains NAD(P)-binding and DUF2867 domains [Prauserella salsuginis]